jgi:HJR/Mrr/RecB family endonuclease
MSNRRDQSTGCLGCFGLLIIVLIARSIRPGDIAFLVFAIVLTIVMSHVVMWSARIVIRTRAVRRQEALARALTIADVDNMPGLEFERYVARLLRYRGFETTTTRASGDLGVDILAERRGTNYAIQVKRQSGSVSRRAVSDAYAGMAHYGCDVAMVITNSYFSKGAVDLASSTECRLVDRDTLAEWIDEYQSDS